MVDEWAWGRAEVPDFMDALPWRNAAPESLRTSTLLTQSQQKSFAEAMQERDAPHRFWMLRRYSPLGPGVWSPVAFVGLSDLRWENGLAEISLVVNPTAKGQGAGGEAVARLLREAFDTMGLETVCGEVYHCNERGVVFWRAQWKKFGGGYETVTLPRRKRWDGRLWDSMYFTFTAEGYRLARQAVVPA